MAIFANSRFYKLELIITALPNGVERRNFLAIRRIKFHICKHKRMSYTRFPLSEHHATLLAALPGRSPSISSQGDEDVILNQLGAPPPFPEPPLFSREQKQLHRRNKTQTPRYSSKHCRKSTNSRSNCSNTTSSSTG